MYFAASAFCSGLTDMESVWTFAVVAHLTKGVFVSLNQNLHSLLGNKALPSLELPLTMFFIAPFGANSRYCYVWKITGDQQLYKYSNEKLSRTKKKPLEKPYLILKTRFYIKTNILTEFPLFCFLWQDSAHIRYVEGGAPSQAFQFLLPIGGGGIHMPSSIFVGQHRDKRASPELSADEQLSCRWKKVRKVLCIKIMIFFKLWPVRQSTSLALSIQYTAILYFYIKLIRWNNSFAGTSYLIPDLLCSANCFLTPCKI